LRLLQLHSKRIALRGDGLHVGCLCFRGSFVRLGLRLGANARGLLLFDLLRESVHLRLVRLFLVAKSVVLPAELFGEGVALVEKLLRRLTQLQIDSALQRCFLGGLLPRLFLRRRR